MTPKWYDWCFICGIFLACAAIVWAMSGCTIHGPIPDRDPDAGTIADCDDLCDRQDELGCPGAEGSAGPDEVFGTEDDVPCEELCETLMTGNPSFTLYPRCIGQADSCAEVDACVAAPSED